MSRKTFQSKLIKEEGYILSGGTLDYISLLCSSYDLIKEYGIRTSLIKDIEVALELDTEVKRENASRAYFYSDVHNIDKDLSYLWEEEVYNLFSNIAPKGYYYGSSDGDGSCIGWFKFEE